MPAVRLNSVSGARLSIPTVAQQSSVAAPTVNSPLVESEQPAATPDASPPGSRRIVVHVDPDPAGGSAREPAIA